MQFCRFFQNFQMGLIVQIKYTSSHIVTGNRMHKYIYFFVIPLIPLWCDIMKKKCKICGKKFEPTRSWSKYCSDECRNKANSKRVIQYRKKHDPLKVKTIEEMKTKEPYKTNYEKIIEAMNKGSEIKISWKYLLKKTGLSSDTLSRYLAVMRKLGAVEDEYLALSEKYKLEALKLRERDIIMDTDFEHIIFCPPGYKYTFYNPSIHTGYIRYNVEDYDQRSEKIKENLQKAYLGWLGILRDARDNYVRHLWDVKILRYKDVYVLSKFVFCLEMIYEVEEILIWDHPERSPNEQWELLMEIHDRATNRYIKKRYPEISSSQMGALEKIAVKEDELKSKFFDELESEIRSYLDPSLLESIIVIDTPMLGHHRRNGLAEAGIIESLLVDRNKPINIQRVKKKKASEEQLVDYAKNKHLEAKWRRTPVDKGLYVKPPFFKGFFKGFEKDLMRLGFKSGVGDNSLEYFYNRLDEMAEILRIPSLPDDLDALLQK